MNRPPGRSHEHTRANIGACSARGRWLKTKNATTASNDSSGSSIVVKSAWMKRRVGESLAGERELPCREIDARVPPAVGERGRHRPRAASELEHGCIRRQPLEHLVEEPLADARPL